MMLVISDSGPIISLLKINKITLLQEAYGQVVIPDAVFEELTSNPEYVQEARQVEERSFITHRSVGDARNVSLLRKGLGLDAGESEAIALAEELSADLLLMDEQKGRTVARNMGIAVTGTIGFLADCFDEGLLSQSDVEACIALLQANNRFIGAHLYEWLMEHIDGSNDR